MLFDQRGCGRSLPNAMPHDTDLESNRAQDLLEDMEMLRKHLSIPKWLLLGGSWGCTLSLAYAQRYPVRVGQMILFGVTTGRH